MSNVSRTVSLHRPSRYANQDTSTILFNSHYNKGTAFTGFERDALSIRGLLPHAVESIEKQVKRCLRQLRAFETPMSKHNYLTALRERSDTVFYRLVIENLRECFPLIYTPTVGQACLEFGMQYRAAEGMYFSKADRGQMRRMLDNWKHNANDDVGIIVITDGSRILGLGDLGANGMGIPIGKCSLYVAAAGFHPTSTLPIVLDVGTNNTALLEDEFYLGARHRRLPDEEYYPIADELLMAIKDKWPHAVLQFEDFSNDHCFDLLERYRNKMRCFNDDIQGTGAVIAAGFLNAIEMSGVPAEEHRFLFAGAGSAGIGVATLICSILEVKFGIPFDKARKMFWFTDYLGLCHSHRTDECPAFRAPFTRTDISVELAAELDSIEKLVEFVKPTALVGLSGAGPIFTPKALESVSKNAPHPIIFPLSNPTPKAECTPAQAYEASQGRAIVAAGSPFGPVTLADGRVLTPSQGNNMYIFPGVGFGAWLCRATEISESMIIESAVALASLVSDELKAGGEIYPKLEDIRPISRHIAARVMQVAYREGYATAPFNLNWEDIKELEAYVESNMYDPTYLEFNPKTGTIEKTPALKHAAPAVEEEVRELDL